MKHARIVGMIAAATLLAAAASACGGAGANAPDPSDRLTMPIPAKVANLRVVPEPKATKKLRTEAGRNSYVRDASVFALREGKELKAVLQVIRLTPDARPEDREFRKSVACQIGGTCRQPTLVNGVIVYSGVVNEQVFYIWFIDRFMQVLIVRQTLVTGGPSSIDIQKVLKTLLAVKPVAAG